MTHLAVVPARSLLLLSLLLLTIPLFALAQRKNESQSGSPGSARAANDAVRATSIPANSRVSITIEQPGTLVPFFERLYHLNAGDPAPVHIVHFGDSHSAADDWTAELRRMLKDRFGDGGSGFSLAGKPFQGYRRFDVQGGGSPGWHADGLRPTSSDGYFGLGGISSSTRLEGQSIFIETECDL